MFVATLLIFISAFDLRYDLTKLGITSDTVAPPDLKEFDPSVILIFILLYLLARLIVVARWYIPISKSEYNLEKLKVEDLSKNLKAFMISIQDIQNPTTSVKEISNEHISSINIATKNINNSFRKSFHSLYALSEELANSSQTSRSAMSKEVDEVSHKINDIKMMIDSFNSIFPAVAETSTGLRQLNKIMDSLPDIDKMDAVIKTLKSVDAKYAAAISWKNILELHVFGWGIPIAWSSIALTSPLIKGIFS